MEFDNILSKGLESWNIDITEEQKKSFKIFMDTLLEYNKVMNLTTIDEPMEVYTKHFLDSLSCLSIDELKAIELSYEDTDSE